MSLFLKPDQLNDVIVSMLDAKKHLQVALSVLPRRLFGLGDVRVQLFGQSAVGALDLLQRTARLAPEQSVAVNRRQLRRWH